MVYTNIDYELAGRKPEQMGKGFWNDLALHGTISEDDMRKYEEFFNWRKLSDHQQMSEDFIREYQNEVHWDRITQRIRMSEAFIEEFQDKVVWDYVWSYQKKLSCDFIERNLKGHGRVDWKRIVMYQKLTDDFMKRHLDEISIGSILCYQKPKKDMVDFLGNYIKTLSEDKKYLVEENFLCYKIEKFDVTEEEMLRYIELRENRGWGGGGWWIITEHQKLSEDFIEKNYNRIKKDFKSINDLWRKQKLSEKFLKKHETDVLWNDVKKNKKIKKTDWIQERIDKYDRGFKIGK